LHGLGSKEDNINNYYIEGKVFATKSIRNLSGAIFFGYGGYLNTSHHFIEYGLGVGYSIKKFTYGVSYSNWDNGNYITPSITYNF